MADAPPPRSRPAGATPRPRSARVRDVLARMRREKTPVTVAAVSRPSGVSRTFLYSNPEARAAAGRRHSRHPGPRGAGPGRATTTGQEATWRERALNAEDALKAAHAEIVRAA